MYDHLVCGVTLTNDSWCQEDPRVGIHEHAQAIDRTLDHIAYVDQRYRYTEGDTHFYSEPHPVRCGHFNSAQGGTVLCDECEAEAKQRYPQGWRYYPGDICDHGRYTGGCGIDWMCQECEG